jgi:2-amino-4-hydroxy-6-hydroxymethyldihydropteridine diphosphokinase
VRDSTPKSQTTNAAPAGPLAVIALGANLGQAQSTILQAMDELQKLSDFPLSRSSLWQTDPVDCPPGSPKFINAVVALVPRPNETPESLLRKLQLLERRFGRQPKKIINEPRPLDLDLIVFGQELRATDELTLPHPRAHRRRFVLQPLSEIAPELIIAGQSKSVADLLETLPLDPTMAKAGTGNA